MLKTMTNVGAIGLFALYSQLAFGDNAGGLSELADRVTVLENPPPVTAVIVDCAAGDTIFGALAQGAGGALTITVIGQCTETDVTGAVTYYFQLEPTGYDRAESMIMVMGLNSHTDNDDHSERRVLAVVGGTGRYANATGEVRETVIGRNNVDGRNLRFHFRLRDAKNGHGRGYGHDYDDD
jgi:hypothetical protein